MYSIYLAKIGCGTSRLQRNKLRGIFENQRMEWMARQRHIWHRIGLALKNSIRTTITEVKQCQLSMVPAKVSQDVPTATLLVSGLFLSNQWQ